MDYETLGELIKEAKKHHHEANKRFDKWDRVDDMHERDMWQQVVFWLEGKL